MPPIHETYLPFEAEDLLSHFAAVSGPATDRERHLSYYLTSARNYDRLRSAETSRWGTSAAQRRTLETYGHQMQKDERLWVVTALKSLFDRPDRVEAFAELFRRGTGSEPTGSTWVDLMGDARDLQLFFEVNLPAPTSYRAALAATADSAIFLPWLRELVRSRRGVRLEGTTKVDAMLVSRSSGFAAAFEAKVLSDVSTHTTYDPTRNQLARLVDVLLDEHPTLTEPSLTRRRPDRTHLFLLTPRLFQQKRHSRLYGELLRGYRTDPALLSEHLPHRAQDQLERAADRLGWVTWEDCEEVVPDTCPWLDAAAPETSPSGAERS